MSTSSGNMDQPNSITGPRTPSHQLPSSHRIQRPVQHDTLYRPTGGRFSSFIDAIKRLADVVHMMDQYILPKEEISAPGQEVSIYTEKINVLNQITANLYSAIDSLNQEKDALNEIIREPHRDQAQEFQTSQAQEPRGDQPHELQAAQVQELEGKQIQKLRQTGKT
ncbi:uncharacterized protein BP5553_04116 [Venustampulla echinocandica]|uniref:Uncharacterized protein n=1 Tax=Venustampulla echinocandica TaxID=2656787 RepID=A0A370TW69_9HELO|nr:uncharacterized protein BP5553_04116 [Venustampulla echinocandica]RDL39776.1 hypothetical protein BP5553_04116 [Venustampulla echinocandica]